MNELAHLHALLNCVYGLEPVTLTSLHLFAHTDRGIYRVDALDRVPLVLRTQKQAETGVDGLARSAATLLHLQAENFPAPRVQQTKDGAPIGVHDGWAALVVTYIADKMSTGR
ncbi:MAG: hypothetical protein H6641_24685 [Caldilineaceae bacterium]|nr:hypothetical protein [Caldilineaceae bacterium]